ncbi:hypothetical protein NQ317_018610 [Molorchus minor]|uniref:Protein kinase domain-containing protein n=1 Tax=Molorchus minor TaxID=1323400 RepID=A0ABQ9JGI7_9CUCU|nr:hypothetical protein NQ317_018610 [Molorchus minor]
MAVQYVMSQLASAIVYLHSKWIFHGDVKPENIIVFGVEKNNRLRIKLTDFGRAGSFYYMAPELHLGFPFDLTADLYSAGVLMYEMLIGTKPFAELTKDQYIVMLRKRMSIVMPQFDTSHLSAQCFGLLSSLLSYDKQNRLFGESLAKHPFINIEPIVDQQCHYSKACEFIVSGVTHVNNGQLGSGYIDVVEAALHLSIHINQQSDEILYHQLVEKLKEYIRYGDKVELRLLNDFSGSPLNIQTKDEKLRCLIKSTPQLLAAYDICSIGEMYLKQNSSKRGFELVRQGLEVLLPALGKEPDGPRKNLLAAKIDEWMKMLENVKKGRRTGNSIANNYFLYQYIYPFI